MDNKLALQDKAEDVARTLATLSNPRRLLVLCRLMQAGEASVSQLVEAVGLSQSALSQHLALMRSEGLLQTRKEGLNVYYSIADPRVAELFRSLEGIFCRARETEGR